MSSTNIEVDGPQLDKSSTRKRVRAESGSSNDIAKKRGRPRRESQDESAADRRRTQIRVAQRAYRQRKEDTIGDLRKQVQDLQDTINSMNQTFRDFSARCSNANDPSAILADLQSLSQQHTSLQNLPSPPGSSEPSSAIEVEQVSEPAEVVTFAHNTDHRMSNHQKPYQYRAEQPSRNSPIGIVSPTDTQSGRGSELHLISAVPRIETHGITPTPLSFMQSLEAPSSYSFGERTFARRLHRTSCEYAYRLACDPTRLPHLFNNVFRLTLQAAGSVDRVKYSLADTLSRGVKEPLNNWGATYIHIGGAGTHFPRSNDEGGSVYQPSDSWTITTVGPHKLVGRTMEEAVTADMLLRGTAGMDGEWFDAYDVEGYLVEKGIFLNPNSTFAEIELLDEQPTTPKSLPDSTLMGLTSYQMHSRAPAAFRSASELPASRSDLSDMRYTHFDASANSFTTKLPEQQPPSDNHGMVSRFDGLLYGTHTPSPIAVHPYQIQPPRGKSKFTIDIAEFCNQMSMAGSCLMRAPGYRRKDIDIALRKSAVFMQ